MVNTLVAFDAMAEATRSIPELQLTSAKFAPPKVIKDHLAYPGMICDRYLGRICNQPIHRNKERYLQTQESADQKTQARHSPQLHEISPRFHIYSISVRYLLYSCMQLQVGDLPQLHEISATLPSYASGRPPDSATGSAGRSTSSA